MSSSAGLEEPDVQVFTSPSLSYRQNSFRRTPLYHNQMICNRGSWSPGDYVDYSQSPDLVCDDTYNSTTAPARPEYVMQTNDDIPVDMDSIQRDYRGQLSSPINSSTTQPLKLFPEVSTSNEFRKIIISQRKWSSFRDRKSKGFTSAKYPCRFHQTDDVNKKPLFEIPSGLGHTDKYIRGAIKIPCTASKCGHPKNWADENEPEILMRNSSTQCYIIAKDYKTVSTQCDQTFSDTKGIQVETLISTPAVKRPKLQRMNSVIQCDLGVINETQTFATGTSDPVLSTTTIGTQCRLPCRCGSALEGQQISHVVIPAPEPSSDEPVIRITTDNPNMSIVHYSCPSIHAAGKSTSIKTMSLQQRNEQIVYPMSTVRRSATGNELGTHEHLDYSTDRSILNRTLSGTISAIKPRLFNETKNKSIKLMHYKSLIPENTQRILTSTL